MERQHANSCWRICFSKADHLERKNQERTNWQRAKEQRLVHSFAGCFASWALAVRIYLLQLRGSWFSFDQRSKSEWLQIPNGSHRFHWSNDTAWSTVGVTLFPSRERDWNIQHSNLPTQTIELIGEEHHVFHGALHWLGSDIPQLWPATLEVKLSTLSLG